MKACRAGLNHVLVWLSFLAALPSLALAEALPTQPPVETLQVPDTGAPEYTSTPLFSGIDAQISKPQIILLTQPQLPAENRTLQRPPTLNAQPSQAIEEIKQVRQPDSFVSTQVPLPIITDLTKLIEANQLTIEPLVTQPPLPASGAPPLQ